VRRLSLLILTLALAAGACSGSDQEIARVAGAPIRISDVDALFEGDTLAVDDSFREALFRLVAAEAITQGLLADFGATTDAAAVDGYLAEFEATMAERQLTPAQFLGVANASTEMVRFNAELAALSNAAIDKLLVAPSTVDTLFSDPDNVTTVCVEHILVATEEAAEVVKARLEAGEDLASVAAEVTIDTASPDGNLGCSLAGNYVDAFARAAAEAPLGEVAGPVETEYGFHVLVVSERTVLTRAEYLADPKAAVTDDEIAQLWTQWFNGVLQAADVWVDPRYGTWTATGIRAPGADPTTTTSAG